MNIVELPCKKGSDLSDILHCGIEVIERLDEVLIKAKLPEGWKKVHMESYHSKVLDQYGRARLQCFFKGASYDYDGHTYALPRFSASAVRDNGVHYDYTSALVPVVCDGGIPIWAGKPLVPCKQQMANKDTHKTWSRAYDLAKKKLEQFLAGKVKNNGGSNRILKQTYEEVIYPLKLEKLKLEYNTFDYWKFGQHAPQEVKLITGEVAQRTHQFLERMRAAKLDLNKKLIAARNKTVWIVSDRMSIEEDFDSNSGRGLMTIREQTAEEDKERSVEKLERELTRVEMLIDELQRVKQNA